MIQIAILISLNVIGASMLLVMWRLLRGPTVPDRILALDTLNINAIMLLVLHGMYARTQVHLEAALVIAMLGFTGTVVLTKFVLRRDIIE